MVFLTESWFWRGTQSAIFYYVACTPWVEYKHNRKRRKEAERARKEREENVIYEQPGVIRQPAPFQTNEEWAQEIVQGPGPPKGWKKDSLYYKYVRTMKDDVLGQTRTRNRAETTTSTNSPAKSDWTATTASSSTAVASLQRPPEAYITDEKTVKRQDTAIEQQLLSAEPREPPVQARSQGPYNGTGDKDDKQQPLKTSSTTAGNQRDGAPEEPRYLHSSSSRETETTGSKRSSFDSLPSKERKSSGPRPSMEKRLSSAMDGFKDAMRGALHPDRWNWIRYERDDEILSNLNERMKGMWGSVKGHMAMPGDEASTKLKQVETKESRSESEVKKWQRGTHPALNELHPPIVSQLPYTPDEAKWMLLPPASADVMMGRARPNAIDDIRRQPLCVIGRPSPLEEARQDVEVQSAGSDDEGHEISESGEEEWMAGGTHHLQKPQRPHLWKHRASYAL